MPVIKMGNDDRAANGAAKVVADDMRLGGRSKGYGIEGRILVIPEGCPMQLIGATLGDKRDFTRLAEFRIVQHAVYAQLGDRLPRGKGILQWLVARCVLRGNAIDGHISLRWKTALHRESNARPIAGACI